MNKFIFFLFIITIIPCYSQDDYKIDLQTISKEFTTTRKTKIDFSKLYNKTTGKKISEKRFHKLIRDHKNFSIEEVVNNKGEVEKFLLSFTNKKEKYTPFNTSDRPKIGAVYPEIEVKTIFNKPIKLKDLKGKIIILRFELFADNFRFKKDEIKALDSLMNTFGKDNFKALLLFSHSTKNEIINSFDYKNSNFEAVENSLKLSLKLKINRYPSTLIINKKGILVDYYRKIEDINLEKILME